MRLGRKTHITFEPTHLIAEGMKVERHLVGKYETLDNVRYVYQLIVDEDVEFWYNGILYRNGSVCYTYKVEV